MSFFNVKQSWIAWIPQHPPQVVLSFSQITSDCRRAQTSVEFSQRHLCIVKMEHLFLPSSACLFTDYLSMWRPPYYPWANLAALLRDIAESLWNSMGPIIHSIASNTQLFLNSKAWSWEAGLFFLKVEPFLMCHTYPRVHRFSIWNHLFTFIKIPMFGSVICHFCQSSLWTFLQTIVIFTVFQSVPMGLPHVTYWLRYLVLESLNYFE